MTASRTCTLSLEWRRADFQVRSQRRVFRWSSPRWISDRRQLGCGTLFRTFLRPKRSWNRRYFSLRVPINIESTYHCTRPFSLSATQTHSWSGTKVKACGTAKEFGGVMGYGLEFPENEFRPHSKILSPAKLNLTILELQYPSATKKSPLSSDATLVGLQKSFADFPGTKAWPRTAR